MQKKINFLLVALAAIACVACGSKDADPAAESSLKAQTSDGAPTSTATKGATGHAGLMVPNQKPPTGATK